MERFVIMINNYDEEIEFSIIDYFSSEDLCTKLTISSNDLLNAIDDDTTLESNSNYTLFMLSESDIDYLIKLNLVSGKFLKKICQIRHYFGARIIETYFENKLNSISEESFIDVIDGSNIIAYIDFKKIGPHLIVYKNIFNKLCKCLNINNFIGLVESIINSNLDEDIAFAIVKRYDFIQSHRDIKYHNYGFQNFPDLNQDINTLLNLIRSNETTRSILLFM